MLQGCSLFKQCGKLPKEHCAAGVQAVKAVSESTCRALCCMGGSLFKRCLNLPARHFLAGVWAV